MKNTKSSITVKILTFSALLLLYINLSQFFFVNSTLMQIIQKEKEAQFDERVNVLFQTLEQEEKTLQETIEAYASDDSMDLELKMMVSGGEGGSSSGNLIDNFRPEYQNNALRALEAIYYTNSNDKIVPFILDRYGMTVMHQKLGRKSSDLRNLDSIKEVLSIKNGSLEYEEEGIKKWIVFRTYSEWGWTACYTMTLDEKFAAVKQFNRLFQIILIGSMVIFLILIFISLKALLKPLSTVESKITEISTGEGDLTKEVTVKSRDEVGQLAGSFNAFIQQLKIIVNNIKNASSQTLKIRDELAANTEETASSLVQISTNVSNMRNHITKLDENINTSSTSINEIDTNITSLNTQMQDQSAMVRETSASVTQMISSIGNVSKITRIKSESSEQLLKTSEDGGTQSKETSAIFKREIGDNVDKIGEMVTVISAIASKTNLLSMNAAIEAAHAGEAGLGFAVVADEIRKLAEESTRQVKDIKLSIKGIFQGIEKTDKSIATTDQAFALINGEIKEVVGALSEILASTEELTIGGQQILEAMTALNNITINISSSAEQMEKGSAYVNTAMSDVTRISNEVANGMDEVVNGTDEVTQAMGEIAGLTMQLGNSSDKLGDEINRFKTEEYI